MEGVRDIENKRVEFVGMEKILIKGPLLKLSQNGDIDDSNFEGRFSIK